MSRFLLESAVVNLTLSRSLEVKLTTQHPLTNQHDVTLDVTAASSTGAAAPGPDSHDAAHHSPCLYRAGHLAASIAPNELLERQQLLMKKQDDGSYG